MAANCGGLAFAIAADQAHSFRRLDFQRDLIQQGPVAIGERDIVETNEWHGMDDTNVGMIGPQETLGPRTISERANALPMVYIQGDGWRNALHGLQPAKL